MPNIFSFHIPFTCSHIADCICQLQFKKVCWESTGGAAGMCITLTIHRGCINPTKWEEGMQCCKRAKFKCGQKNRNMMSADTVFMLPVVRMRTCAILVSYWIQWHLPLISAVVRMAKYGMSCFHVWILPLCPLMTSFFVYMSLCTLGVYCMHVTLLSVN